MWALFRGREYDLFNKERKGGPFPWVLGGIGFVLTLFVGWIIDYQARNRLSNEAQSARVIQDVQKVLRKTNRLVNGLSYFRELKLRHFPNCNEAVETGDKLVRLLVLQRESESVAGFIGKEAAFIGEGQWPYIEMDLEIPIGIRLKTQLTPSQVEFPRTHVWTACVLGTIESVDRANKVITTKMKPENWKFVDLPQN